jgi:hypothetical protein
MDESAIAQLAALATVAASGAAAAFGGVRWWLVAPSGAAWALLRAGQAVAVAQALVAGALAVAGYDPADGLYWLYALLPVAINFVAEQLRVVSAEQVLENRELPDAQAMGALPEAEQRSIVLSIMRRELGIMALAAFVVAFLSLRAALVV